MKGLNIFLFFICTIMICCKKDNPTPSPIVYVIGNDGASDSYGGIMKIDEEQVQLMTCLSEWALKALDQRMRS